MVIPVVIENPNLKPTLAIPIGAPVTLANETIELSPLNADKTIKTLS